MCTVLVGIVIMYGGPWQHSAVVQQLKATWQKTCVGDAGEDPRLYHTCWCVTCSNVSAACRVSGGLPDLLLWRTCDKSAKLVEVKGPRDRLSDQQRFWLAHMDNNTMQVWC